MIDYAKRSINPKQKQVVYTVVDFDTLDVVQKIMSTGESRLYAENGKAVKQIA